MSITVMKQALEALDEITDDVDGTGLNTKPSFYKAMDAMSALRTAIEQAEQAKPKAQLEQQCAHGIDRKDCGWCSPQPAQQAEPFGYFKYDIRLDAWVMSRHATAGIAFYTHPKHLSSDAITPELKHLSYPAREWVGLTKREIEDAAKYADKHGSGPWHAEYARLIENKLKEKNT